MPKSANFSPRLVIHFLLCSTGLFLGLAGRAASPSKGPETIATTTAAATWSIVPTPNTSSTVHNYLRDASCASASDCWAVGYAQVGAVYQTLIEHWNGNAWTIVASPNTSTSQGQVLRSAACASTSDCWAVGYYDNTANGAYQTLIEHWDGNTWTIVPSPNTDSTLENGLYGATCASSNDCWAVGYAYTLVGANTGLGIQTLVEHWDGNAWTVVTSPNTLALDNDILASVTCSSSSNCWAAGYYFTATSNVFQTLIEKWDGSSWTIVSSPNTDTSQNNLLYGVACPSAAAECWAAGSYDNADGISQTLIERWDGNAWNIAVSANADTTQSNSLASITCTSTSNCWAAGNYFASNGPGIVDRTLIERWDGNAWSVVITPNTSDTEGNFLFGVNCASDSDCWGIGAILNASNKVQTLALHYIAPSPVPVSVVSRKAHGSAGDFDIDLPLIGDSGIECRSGLVAGSHRVIVTFASAATVSDATVTPGQNGTASLQLVPGANHAEVLIDLSNVSNAQTLTINLFGVSDGTSTGDLHIPMGVLLGDVNASGNVDAADVGQVQRQNNKPVNNNPGTSTFRMDVNLSGNIDAADVGQVQRQNSKHL